MKNSFSAVGPMVGYLFQCRQALLLSIELSKTFPTLNISIEKFDDIAVEHEGKPAAQLQLKHHIAPGALTDSSVDLWKTLRVWSEGIKANPQLPFETRFVLVSTGTAPDGSAAALLRPERSSADLSKALGILENVAGASKNVETSGARQAFLTLSQPERRSLLAAVMVFDQAPNITDVRSEIEDRLTFAVPQDQLSKLVDHLEGWWFNNVVEALVDNQHPPLSLLAVRAKIDELAAALKKGELVLNPGLEEEPDAAELATDDRVFVRQMHCIGLQQPSIELAKRDFYRATTQRSEWARENALLDGEAMRYDNTLVDRWQREREALADTVDLTTDEAQRKFGRSLFHWANRFQLPFRNRHENWLTTGSFHMLADRPRLGWHPDFLNLFNVTEEE